MNAKPVNAILIKTIETLPNGIKVLTTECPDYAALKELPQVVELDGEVYGRTGWNSDDCIAYFRTDAVTANVIR